MRVFFLLFLVIAISAEAQLSPDSLMRAVEQGLITRVVLGKKGTVNISDRMNERKVNGVSIAVIDKKTIAWSKGYGISDAADPGSVVDTATVFQCASIGKIITAMAALELVKEGRISLDEDINNKLVNWKLPENNYTAQKKVTLRFLLSHSSGLTDNYGFMGYKPGSAIPSLPSILNAEPPAENRKKLIVENIPGTTENYSGGGYMIIQQLIEDITGQPFAIYVNEKIFRQLNMTHTAYAGNPHLFGGKNVAMAHNDKGKRYNRVPYRIYPEHAAAGPWTTPNDLARLVIAIQQQIAYDSVLKKMLQPQINSMGLGPHLKGDSTVTGFWHAGNTEGYTGILMATTSTGQGAVVLTNSNSGEWLALELIRGIARIYQWPVNLSIASLPIDDPSIYSGRYSLGEGKTLKVETDKDGLYFTRNGKGKKFYLFQTSPDHFRIAEKPDNLLFVFQRNEKGLINALRMYENAGQSKQLFLRIE